MPRLLLSGLQLCQYNKQTENVPRHWNLILHIAKLLSACASYHSSKERRNTVGIEMQQIAFPAHNLGAATLPRGMRVVTIDAGQLASVPDNAVGLRALQ